MDAALTEDGGAVGARTGRVQSEMEAFRGAMRDPRAPAELALDEAAARLLEEIAPGLTRAGRSGPGVAEGTTPEAARQ